MTHPALTAPTAAFQSLSPVLPGFRAAVKEEQSLVPWGKAAAGAPRLEHGGHREGMLSGHAPSAERRTIESLIQKPRWRWKGEFPQTFSPSLIPLVLIWGVRGKSPMFLAGQEGGKMLCDAERGYPHGA